MTGVIFSAEETLIIGYATSVSGTLSALSIIVVFGHVWWTKDSHWSFSTQVLVILLAFNMCFTLSAGIGRKVEHDERLCLLQGVCLQFGGVACMLWTCFISWYMFKLIVLKKNTIKISRKIPRDILIVVVLSGGVSVLYAALDLFKPTSLWCWVDEAHQDARFYGYYNPLVATWFLCVAALVLIRRSMISAAMGSEQEKQKQKDSSKGLTLIDLSRSEKLIFYNLVAYIAVFLFTYGFGWLNRLQDAINPLHKSFPLTFLQALFNPLQGFFNCIIYSGAVVWIYNFVWFGRDSDDSDVVVQWTLRDDENYHRIMARDLNLTFAPVDDLESANVLSSTPKEKRSFRILENVDEVTDLPNSVVMVNGSSDFLAAFTEIENRANRLGSSFANAGAAPEGPIAGSSVESQDCDSFLKHSDDAHSANLKDEHFKSAAKDFRDVSIFTTTYNMKEMPLDQLSFELHVRSESIDRERTSSKTASESKKAKKRAAKGASGCKFDDWIPKDYDVYAIAVQECIDVAGLMEKVLEYLNYDSAGRNSSMHLEKQTANAPGMKNSGGNAAYVGYLDQSGGLPHGKIPGYHGNIGIIVILKKVYVDSGHMCTTISMYNNQKSDSVNATFMEDAPVFAAALPVQIFDASVVFVSVHFPSDDRSQGRLDLRNQAAYRVLREVSMTAEGTFFDLQQQHHHTFILGDLNYRVVKPREKDAKMGNISRSDDGSLWNSSDEKLRISTLESADDLDANATITAVAKATLREREVLDSVAREDLLLTIDPSFYQRLEVNWNDRKTALVGAAKHAELHQELYFHSATSQYQHAQSAGVFKSGGEGTVNPLVAASLNKAQEVSALLINTAYNSHRALSHVRKQSLHNWRAVTCLRDELLHCRRVGQTLFGFDEGLGLTGLAAMNEAYINPAGVGFPVFPPTFKRKSYEKLVSGRQSNAGRAVSSISRLKSSSKAGGGGSGGNLADNSVFFDFSDPIAAVGNFAGFGLISAYHSNIRVGKTADDDTRQNMIIWDDDGWEQSDDESYGDIEMNINSIINSYLPIIKPVKFRHPSYPDRILYSSLSDRRGRLLVLDYDSCEHIYANTRRPVNMIAKLLVNTSVCFRKFYTGRFLRPLPHIREFKKKTGSSTDLAGLQQHGGGDEAIGRMASTAAVSVTITNTDNIYYIFELTVVDLRATLPEFKQHLHLPPVGTLSPLTSSLVSLLNIKEPLQTVNGPAHKNISCKTVNEIGVIFPLPSSDPLLLARMRHQRAKDCLSTGLGEGYNPGQFGDKEERLMHHLNAIGSYYSDRAAEQLNVLSTEGQLFRDGRDAMIGANSLRLPITSFGFPAENRPAVNPAELSIPLTVHQCASIKVRGCVIPALGAHVLIKFQGSKSTSNLCYGSCVVSLTQLIDTTKSVCYASGRNEKQDYSKTVTLNDLPIVDGSVLRGVASGTFSLQLLAVVEHP